MINAIEIENYKSIQKLKLKLGRVNLLIGENGCGKSNILEAIALASAASTNKLDSEFLLNRGIRLSSAELMRSNFVSDTLDKPIVTTLYPSVDTGEKDIKNLRQVYSITPDGATYINWAVKSKKLLDTEEISGLEFNEIVKQKKMLATSENKFKLVEHFLNDISKETFKKIQEKTKKSLGENPYVEIESIDALLEALRKDIVESKELLNDTTELVDITDELNEDFNNKIQKIRNFIIYSPENSALRNFYKEGQIEPLGINGEGLLKLIKVISDTEPDGLVDIVRALKLFGWFDEFKIPDEFSSDKDTLQIKDRFINRYIDQRVANEGFLFVLFYMSLIVSKDTPKFFAIDNIDASLNPSLCTKLMSTLVKLSEKYEKQIILTTHNPAILDGVNILDKNQRLNVVSRDSETGETKVRVITPKRKPKSSTKEDLKMSEAMLRGYFGGLPEGF